MIHHIDISRSELEKVIDEWIFNERDRRIAKRRLLDGVCYELLAEEFNLSERHIKNIVYKTESVIIRHL